MLGTFCVSRPRHCRSSGFQRVANRRSPASNVIHKEEKGGARYSIWDRYRFSFLTTFFFSFWVQLKKRARLRFSQKGVFIIYLFCPDHVHDIFPFLCVSFGSFRSARFTLHCSGVIVPFSCQFVHVGITRLLITLQCGVLGAEEHVQIYRTVIFNSGIDIYLVDHAYLSVAHVAASYKRTGVPQKKK